MLMKLIPENGNLVYNVEDENIKSILKDTKCRNIKSYGIGKGDYDAKAIEINGIETRFEIHHGGKVSHVKLNM
ncbi:hypothetical protein, partial [Pseudomonas aeruginosa]